MLSLGTLGERQDSRKGAWRSGLLTEMARALPTNPLLGGWNSKSLLGGGAEAVVSFFSLAVSCFHAGRVAACGLGGTARPYATRCPHGGRGGLNFAGGRGPRFVVLAESPSPRSAFMLSECPGLLSRFLPMPPSLPMRCAPPLLANAIGPNNKHPLLFAHQYKEDTVRGRVSAIRDYVLEGSTHVNNNTLDARFPRR